MYVCVCKAVTDRQIRREVADGITSLRELTRTTGLGTGCGKCVPQAREVLTQALSAAPAFYTRAAPDSTGAGPCKATPRSSSF